MDHRGHELTLHVCELVVYSTVWDADMRPKRVARIENHVAHNAPFEAYHYCETCEVDTDIEVV